MDIQNVKIFIGFASDLKDERNKCVGLINQLSKSHTHLYLESVEWEFDTTNSDPSDDNIQDVIDSRLNPSELVVFLLYSKLAIDTIQLYQYALEHKKRIIMFFKNGFEPIPDSIEKTAFDQLITFKRSLNNTIEQSSFSDIADFEMKFYQNLQLDLIETYAVQNSDTTYKSIYSQAILELREKLVEKESEIEKLRSRQKNLPLIKVRKRIIKVNRDEKSIKEKLLQNSDHLGKRSKESVNMFISYSHKDEKIKDILIGTHMQSIQNYYDSSLIEWTDVQIEPGTNWDFKIKKALETANIIVFLITPNFLASNYIKNTEIKNALDRYYEKKQIIIPIYIEEVSLKLRPFVEKQYLPNSKPLKQWKPQSKGWTKIVDGIIKVIDDISNDKMSEYFQ